MKSHPTSLPGVLLLEPVVRTDDRGFFLETWRADQYRELGIDLPFVQDNHSRSRQGVLRGLHYQIANPQGKLIRVATGEVFDVAVDLRRSSPTFGRWVGVVLSEANQHQLWVPPGFAHGFYTLSPVADLLYKCTAYYSPADDRTLQWDDPEIGIDWPLLEGRPPLVSSKDRTGTSLGMASTYA
jgi:dTDP-4-dehydrorhamnose 3,5-epimerase